jgi:hypothetical protein
MRALPLISILVLMACAGCRCGTIVREFRIAPKRDAIVIQNYSAGPLPNRGQYVAFPLNDGQHWIAVLHSTKETIKTNAPPQAWLVEGRFDYAHQTELQDGSPLHDAEPFDGQIKVQWHDVEHFRIKMDLVGRKTGAAVQGEYRTYVKTHWCRLDEMVP